jgi:hypothetical protein
MREQHSTSSMTQEILGVLCPCHFIIINTPHHYRIEMYQRNTYFISIKYKYTMYVSIILLVKMKFSYQIGKQH